MQWHIKINNRLTDLDRIQTELAELLQKERLTAEKIGDAQLILEEVLVNIINYGYPDQTDQAIDIKVTVDSHQLEMVFQDSGIPFNPLTYEEVLDLEARDDSDKELGGLGIHLIKELSKRIDYQFRDGQNVLTVLCDV